ncbi:MAG TPA: PspA/IM30 family protein [Polyangiales bacterium]|jgi:phage shock protein A|nr:PspA/IM30 family protein [Polyangiales bacterium]
MGIFSRLNRVIKSNLNALIDQAEDPDKMIGQTVADMKAALKRARKDLIEAMGTVKRLESKERELDKEAAEWEQKAILALERDDDDLAREALRRKARTLSEAEKVRARAAEQSTAAEAMRAQLERIEEKLDDLKSRQKTLAAQVRQARNQNPDPGQPTGERLGGGAFSDLDRMADQIDQLDAEVEAHQLLDDPRRAELDARLRALETDEGDDAVDDELAALKAKLNG